MRAEQVKTFSGGKQRIHFRLSCLLFSSFSSSVGFLPLWLFIAPAQCFQSARHKLPPLEAFSSSSNFSVAREVAAERRYAAALWLSAIKKANQGGLGVKFSLRCVSCCNSAQTDGMADHLYDDRRVLAEDTFNATQWNIDKFYWAAGVRFCGSVFAC